MLENEEFFMSIDIKMAENAIKSIIKKATEEKKFSPSGMKARMEEVFQKAGFREKKKPGERARILIIRDDAAGDFILFSSFLREVRDFYKGAHITLETNKKKQKVSENKVHKQGPNRNFRNKNTTTKNQPCVQHQNEDNRENDQGS